MTVTSWHRRLIYFSCALSERTIHGCFYLYSSYITLQRRHMASPLWIQHLEQFVWMVDQTVAIKTPQKRQVWCIFLSAVKLWGEIVMKMSSLTVTYWRLSQLPFSQHNCWRKMLQDCSIFRYQLFFFLEYTKDCMHTSQVLLFTFPFAVPTS